MLPSERPTPGTDPAYWLGRLSRKNRQLAKKRITGSVDDKVAIGAEWTIVTALLRAKASNPDISAFLRRYAVGQRMRSLSDDDAKWVAGMRRRWNDPTKRQKMNGRQAETVAMLDDVWARMNGRWTAFIGFLGLSVKMQKACSLGEVTCSQREVEAFTGTPGQTVWTPLKALPFVIVTAEGTVAEGTEFALPELPVAEPVAFRPSRRFVLKLARHPAVLGKVVVGRLLLTYATVAAGATTVEQVATAWGLLVRTARDWVRATAETGALVLADNDTVTLGKSLDVIAADAGVLDAANVMKERHGDERRAQRENVAAHNARKRPTERFDVPADVEAFDEAEEEAHAGTILTRFVQAVDSPYIRPAWVIAVARQVRSELFEPTGGDVARACEAAWVAGAAVTAWAWARDAVKPGLELTKPGPVLTVARNALEDHLAGSSVADVLARAGRAGAKMRKPLTLEQRIARSKADKQKRLERAIAREQTTGRAPRPLLAVTPRIYQDLDRPAAALVLDAQRCTTAAVALVRAARVVEDAVLKAAWKRALLDAVQAVGSGSGRADLADLVAAATVVGLRAALPGVLVPGPVPAAPVVLEPTGDTGIASVVRLAPRTERRVAA